MKPRLVAPALKLFSDESPIEARSYASSPGLTDACWLRSQVISPAVLRVAEEVPAPLLASANLRHSRLVRDYVLWWIRNPDVGSDFAEKTRWLRWLPGAFLLRAMTSLAYEGMIYSRGSSVLGHVFFQRRQESVFAFSTAVHRSVDGQGYSVVMLLDFLAYASRLSGITRARVGRGQNNVTSRLLARLKARETLLGWQVDADGWVTFASPAGQQLRRSA